MRLRLVLARVIHVVSWLDAPGARLAFPYLCWLLDLLGHLRKPCLFVLIVSNSLVDHSNSNTSRVCLRRIEALDKAFGSALSDVLSVGPSRAAAASTRAKPPRQSAVTKPSPNRYQPAHVNPSESNTSRGEAAGLSEGRGVSSTTYYETLDENIRNGALSAPLRLAEPLKCSPAEFLDDMLTQLMKTNPTRVIDARAQIASRLQVRKKHARWWSYRSP
jgi:hypothetical protein